MGPQIGGYITPGQLLLSDPDVRANTGNGDTWSGADIWRLPTPPGKTRTVVIGSVIAMIT